VSERSIAVRVLVADRHAHPRAAASATARRALVSAYGLVVIDVISVHSLTPRFRGGHVTWSVVARVRGEERMLAVAARAAERGTTWAVDDGAAAT
jgi:hypothetical protein